MSIVLSLTLTWKACAGVNEQSVHTRFHVSEQMEEAQNAARSAEKLWWASEQRWIKTGSRLQCCAQTNIRRPMIIFNPGWTTMKPTQRDRCKALTVHRYDCQTSTTCRLISYISIWNRNEGWCFGLANSYWLGSAHHGHSAKYGLSLQCLTSEHCQKVMVIWEWAAKSGQKSDCFKFNLFPRWENVRIKAWKHLNAWFDPNSRETKKSGPDWRFWL